MSIINHTDYQSELSKLNYTIDYMKKYHNNIVGKKKNIDNAVDYAVTHFNSDNAEQFNELILNTSLQESIAQKIKNIEKSLQKPYFSRVDFKEENNNELQKLYIGKVSLIREEDQDFIVIDWRAPIANLYYEGRIGEANYTCPDGIINGEISLKRQYTIENAELKEFFDIDITTSDEFLQACLSSNKDNRLKDIVSTIQAEQNQVIRADMWKPLIVQGAAGGGKTTIALHRIAYLIYTYEKSFSPKNFMIIAPNRFFLSYISEVLPELGVENVKQTTFEDFALEIVGKKLKIKDSHEKLSKIINNTSLDKNSQNTNPILTNDRIIKVSKFKSSLLFIRIIERYIKELEYSIIPEEDFKIHTFTLLTYKEIKKLFIKEYSYLPFNKRINEIKKHLTNTLNRKKEEILSHVEDEHDIEITRLKLRMDDCTKRRALITEILDRRDALLENIKKHSKTLVKEYINKINILSPFEYYKLIMNDTQKFYELAPLLENNNIVDFLVEDSSSILNENLVELEDLAPIMYIKFVLYGLDEKLNLKHVIIDEAQDFSLAQIYVLKKIINSSSFTILGDLCQGIHNYRGISDWNDVIKYIFNDIDPTFLSLEQSYRTTVEIMNAASSVIGFLNDPKLPPAKPVLRHGEEVAIIEKASLKEISEDIIEKIKSFKNKKYKSAAIICKTLDECLKLKKLLKNYEDIKVITGKENEYSGGIIIIPSYLVKGLEFDMVIVANASKEVYTTDELDVKLLYVAMTRPLHELYIYSEGEKAEMLN